ncbi:putative nucleolar protein [Ordospora pajunii]|uniref:putative nucleolar protein n=1 Tax=Ordospora pajunii TaxID=3039483 RepID=UPI0029527E68|nr:putative nucleolar protein [Ordospora pajunii]KAH9411688.1 putative nucleolar protein [Ordospora pajunii]
MSSKAKTSDASICTESYLAKIYISQPISLPDDISRYVLNPMNVEGEIAYLEKYVESNDVDLTRVVFIIEVLGKCVHKHSEFRMYMNVVTKILEKYKDYQYSVFCLRIIKLVVSSKFYTPISFYLIRILKDAISSRNIVASHKKVSYDSIKPSPERIKSEEHQMFVITEANALLVMHLSTFSKNIGFPELAAVVINELKKLRIGIYREMIENIISCIAKQREYVIEKRKKLKLSGIDGKAISLFESTIEKTLQ